MFRRGETLSSQWIISLSLSLIGLIRQMSRRLSHPDADVLAPHYPAHPTLPKQRACGCCFVCESSSNIRPLNTFIACNGDWPAMFFFLILDLIAAVSQARARVLQIRDLSQCAVSLNRPNSRFDAADLRKRLCIKYQGETSDCGIEDPNCSCTNSQHPGVNTCLTNQCSESEVLQALGFLNDACYCMRFLAG